MILLAFLLSATEPASEPASAPTSMPALSMEEFAYQRDMAVLKAVAARDREYARQSAWETAFAGAGAIAAGMPIALLGVNTGAQSIGWGTASVRRADELGEGPYGAHQTLR